MLLKGMKSITWFVILSLPIGLYFFLLNMYTPFWNDEYNNNFVYGTLNNISNISEIFENQVLLYRWWTGRVVSSFFISVQMYIGKDIFNILNTIVFLLLLSLLTCFHRSSEQTNKSFYFILPSLILLWFGVPVFGETVTWMTGALVYLWVSVPTMLFVLLILKNVIDGRHFGKASKMAVVILGFIAGNSLENFGSAIIAFMILGFFYQKVIIKQKITIFYNASFLSVLAGFCLLVFSPGNQNRLNNSPFKADTKTMLINYVHSFNAVLSEQKVLVIVFISLLIVTVVGLWVGKNKWNNKSKKSFLVALVLFSLGFITFLSMIVSPEFPLRASFPGAMFLIAANITLLSMIYNIFTYKMVSGIIISLCSLLILIPSMREVYKDYHNLAQTSSKRIELIKVSQQEEIKDVYLPALNVNGSRFMYVRDLLTGPNEDQNRSLAKYYGFNSVKLQSAMEIIVQFDSNTLDFYQVFYKKFKSDPPEFLKTSYNGFVTNQAFFGTDSEHIEYLRIDPGTTPGIKIIKSIEFIKRGKKVTLYPEELIKMIQSKGQIGNIRLTEKGLELESLGNDPWFELTGLDSYIKDEEDYIKLNIDGRNTYGYQMFFDMGNGFNEQESVTQNLQDIQPEMDSIYSLKFPLPNPSEIRSIRLDPGNSEQHVSIHSLTIKVGDKEKSYQGKALIDLLVPFTQIKAITLDTDGFVEVLTNGDDPQLIVKNIEGILTKGTEKS
ncbi:DUF6056 family protein [Cohnella suwonensis]|uniref:DUF6056 family protein n=1 Tax=Cohnella suwonensis TaxID=696072 RepID=A0ABW0LVB4_9BACL